MSQSDSSKGEDPGFLEIETLADLDRYTDIVIDSELGAFVGKTLTENCTLYRDIIGGTRMLQFERPPTAREHVGIILEHLPTDAVVCNMEMDPTGTYVYYRCPSDEPA